MVERWQCREHLTFWTNDINIISTFYQHYINTISYINYVNLTLGRPRCSICQLAQRYRSRQKLGCCQSAGGFTCHMFWHVLGTSWRYVKIHVLMPAFWGCQKWSLSWFPVATYIWILQSYMDSSFSTHHLERSEKSKIETSVVTRSTW